MDNPNFLIMRLILPVLLALMAKNIKTRDFTHLEVVFFAKYIL
jgi:hypothetical protein